jgi:diguanylate cyclase (GGDEF)-like protein
MVKDPQDDARDPAGRAGGEAAPPAALDLDATVVSSLRIETSTRRLATLVVVKGVEIGRHYPLRRNRVVLGRGEGADVMIPHKEISRAHAMIEALRMGGETIHRLSDLGSTNRVFVNGQPVERHVLASGDKIQLGDAVLKFELLDAIDEKFHTEIRNRIQYDDLTGLLTYESFRTALQWELERLATSAKGCAVVMMDLDDFKKLNDSYGHLAGSFVLREVGGAIRENLRQFDVSARYGGEEFVAYLPETDGTEALIAAERLRRVLCDGAFVHQARVIRLTISMGIAHFPDDGRQLEALIERADQRLYRAKRDGKNRVYGSG